MTVVQEHWKILFSNGARGIQNQHFQRKKSLDTKVRSFFENTCLIFSFFKIVIIFNNTLISLIIVESMLTDFEKFHPPQKKIPPPQNLFSQIKQKLFKLELSCKSSMFYPISQLFRYKRRGHCTSCNIPTSMFIDFASFAILHVYSNLNIHH